LAFEILDSARGRPEETPMLSLRPDGVIRLNKPAAKLIKHQGMDRVLVLWDKNSRTLALQRAPKNDHRAYRVAFNKAGNMGSVASKFLVGFIGWMSNRSVRVPAILKDGMLQAELPAKHIRKTKDF
jgi:hypothetical protein